MTPLKVILVMIEPPLPFGNAAARWYYVLLKGLAERGHHAAAFAAVKSNADAEEASALFPAPEYRLRCYLPERQGGLASKLSSFRRPHSYLFSAGLRRDLAAELASPYDVLHLEHQWSGWLGLRHTESALLNIHYLFQIDLAGERPVQPLEKLRLARSMQAETHLVRRYPVVGALSTRLTDRVSLLSPAAETPIVAFGMDLTKYPFEPRTGTDVPVVTLIGSFNWSPGHSAGVRLLERLWPSIRQRVPNARLNLVGRRARASFAKYDGVDGVAIHEDVPDTIPYFRQADLMLYAPRRGSGVKVKVLESFALGLPVVTTSEGVEGIPAVDGVHAGVADDDAGLIARTVALLGDPPARARLGRAARQVMEEHFAAAAALDRLEAIYRRILERKRKAH